jgi:hypothetical protein
MPCCLAQKKIMMKKIYTTAALLMFFTLTVNAQNAANTSSNIKFMASGSFGLGFRTAKIDASVPPQLEDHFKELRNGTAFSFELGARVENNGFTLAYSQFSSSSKDYSFTTSVPGPGGPTTASGMISTSDKITVITGNWISFTPLGKNETVFLTSKLGIGAISYRSDNDLSSAGSSSSFELTGTGLALTGGLGLDFKLSKNVYFAVSGDYLNGRAKLKSDQQGLTSTEDDEPEGLTHIRFTGGLRIIL